MAIPDLSDPDAAVAFAIAALQNQEEEQALAPVAEAAARHPANLRLWQLLGGLHRALDELAPAVAAYERAVRLAPDDGASAHMLARSLLEGGLPAKAPFERAQALAPEDDIVRL
ncbi:MAG TPA: tetratricopeptide repeat protein, partial [Allosphingosinicella sp.]|nr:tetratricopeptide repeat protein [Allosphingosinicella sp.]